MDGKKKFEARHLTPQRYLSSLAHMRVNTGLVLKQQATITLVRSNLFSIGPGLSCV